MINTNSKPPAIKARKPKFAGNLNDNDDEKSAFKKPSVPPESHARFDSSPLLSNRNEFNSNSSSNFYTTTSNHASRSTQNSNPKQSKKTSLSYNKENENSLFEVVMNPMLSSRSSSAYGAYDKTETFYNELFSTNKSLNMNINQSIDTTISQPKTKNRHMSLMNTSKSTNELYTAKQEEPSSSRGSNGKIMMNSSILRGIFTFRGVSVDVELDDNMIKFEAINEKIKAATGKIELAKFYNVEPKYSKFYKKSNSTSSRRSNNEDDKDLLLNGFKLHMFVNDKPNYYKYKLLEFSHPHTDTCKEFIYKLRENIPALQSERELIVLVNPYAGEKKSRFMFNHYITPILDTSNVKYTTIEFHDRLPLKETLMSNKIDLNEYYGIIVMAGDSSVSKVINTMIEMESQKKENLNVFELNEMKTKLTTPICIIPVGSTNMIATSIYGQTDALSPLTYLLYNKQMRIDMSAVFNHLKKLHSFGFGYSCGFGTTMARYMQRYHKLGTNKVKTALTRGTVKNKHRVIEAEIKYIKSKATQPCDEKPCFRECNVCNPGKVTVKNKERKEEIATDFVEEFKLRRIKSVEEINLDATINSISSNEYKRDDDSTNEWQTIRGSFIHIACLTNATHWDQASAGGLSKYAHLGDGCIDLVLVENVSRKDFYRFIKRHANKKNQLNLPFVKSIRVKEAQIRILNNDESFDVNENISHITLNDNNILNRVSRSKNESRSRSNAKMSRSDDEDTEDEDYDSRIRTSASYNLDAQTNEINLGRVSSIKVHENSGSNVYFIKPPLPNKGLAASANFDSQLNLNHKSNNENKSFLKKSLSIANLFKSDEASNKKSKKSNNQNLSNTDDCPSYRPNIFDRNENNFTNSKSFKMPTVWNCDWNLNNLREIHIKCLKQILPVFACGLDPHTDLEDMSLSNCLPGI